VAPQLTIGQDGRLYLIWLAAEWRKSWDVLFSRSEDVGATWSQPISFKPEKSTVAGGVRIAAGLDGNVYAAWRERDQKTKSRHLQFVRSQDHGVRWERPQLLGDPGDAGIPSLLTDYDGGVYVASLVGSGSQRALQVAMSHDFGATFSPTPTRLTAALPTSEYGVMNHRVASDGEGRFYAVWEEINETHRESRIYLNRSFGGRTWATQPVLVSAPVEGEHLAHEPQIIAAPKGRVYVVWEQAVYREGSREQAGTVRGRERFLYINRSLDDGQTWLPQPIRLNEVGQGHVASLSPQLGTDQHGNVYAIWIEEQGRDRARLFFTRSIDFGMTWSAPRVRLDLSSPLTGSLANPEIRNDNAGHVWVLWQELNLGPKGWHLLMNRSEDHGESWQKQAAVLTGLAQRGGRFRDASFVSDGRGRLAVAWDGGPKNAQELYVNRSADFGATWLLREVRVGP